MYAMFLTQLYMYVVPDLLTNFGYQKYVADFFPPSLKTTPF